MPSISTVGLQETFPEGCAQDTGYSAGFFFALALLTLETSRKFHGCRGHQLDIMGLQEIFCMYLELWYTLVITKKKTKKNRKSFSFGLESPTPDPGQTEPTSVLIMDPAIFQPDPPTCGRMEAAKPVVGL